MQLRDLAPSKLTTTILAGGMSRRMGRDKALIEDDRGVPWLVKIAREASVVSSNVLVMTGPTLRYRDVDFPKNVSLMRDDICGYGPLGGLFTALSDASTPYLLCLTCDMPDVSSMELGNLPVPTENEDAVFYAETFFPLVIRVTADLPALISRQIQTGNYAVKTFLSTIRSHPMNFDRAPLRNINTPLEI